MTATADLTRLFAALAARSGLRCGHFAAGLAKYNK